MSRILKVLLAGMLALFLAGAGLYGAGWYWAEHAVAMDEEQIEYIIEPGSGVRTVAQSLNRAGIHMNAAGFLALARLTGQDTRIKAGAYLAQRGDTPRQILERMANGDMVRARITFIEGWTWPRIRATIAGNARIRQTLEGADDAEVLRRLGLQQASLEGLFYPDTYVFVPGTTDLDILRQAHDALKLRLDALWPTRNEQLRLASPYEALILASLIEKETGHGEDRARISGVFANRLRVGMPLQTDPSVIYGMGETYKGRIRKADLQRDTPWNTYTRPGLPPTPIAISGLAALEAALHPEQHDFFYFVARGDGTSEFSRNLAAHNRAVAKYILGRRQ